MNYLSKMFDVAEIGILETVSKVLRSLMPLIIQTLIEPIWNLPTAAHRGFFNSPVSRTSKTLSILSVSMHCKIYDIDCVFTQF